MLIVLICQKAYSLISFLYNFTIRDKMQRLAYAANDVNCFCFFQKIDHLQWDILFPVKYYLNVIIWFEGTSIFH